MRLAWFQDEGSFISQPKAIKGECDEPRSHLLLEGLDKGPIRAEIFRRNREVNHNVVGGTAHCWNCGRTVFETLPESIAKVELIGQWDHIRNKPGERCDCPENGARCLLDLSQRTHPQTQFGKSKIVEEMGII